MPRSKSAERLEGLAARLAAERGAGETELGEMKRVLSALDQLVFGTGVTADNFSAYVEMNERFHQTVIATRRQRRS